MSSRDNSYSQLTKRLRSKYNAAFYQNNNQRPINVFDSVTGDTSNPWLNALVTGRKDVINTSDVGKRNVDESCVCATAAAPAPAPAPAPVVPRIELMIPGSLYAGLTNGNIFKGNTPTLSEDWIRNLTGYNSELLYKGDNYIHIVNKIDIETNIGYFYRVLNSNGDVIFGVRYENAYVLGVNDVSIGDDIYVYISHINGGGNSYIDVYKNTDFITTINISSIISAIPLSISNTVLMGNILYGSDNKFYTFVRAITSQNIIGEYTYNIYLLTATSPTLEDVIPGDGLKVQKLIVADITTLSDYSIPSFFAYQCNPTIYTPASGPTFRLISAELMYNIGANNGYQLITYDIGGLSDDTVGIYKLLSGGQTYSISSPIIGSTYIYFLVDQLATIVGYNKDLLGGAIIPSSPTEIDAKNYIFCSDGTYLYRWQHDGAGSFTIAKYDQTDNLTFEQPIAESNPYSEIGFSSSPNIIFTSGKLYANTGDLTISEIDPATCNLASPLNSFTIVPNLDHNK